VVSHKGYTVYSTEVPNSSKTCESSNATIQHLLTPYKSLCISNKSRLLQCGVHICVGYRDMRHEITTCWLHHRTVHQAGTESLHPPEQKTLRNYNTSIRACIICVTQQSWCLYAFKKLSGPRRSHHKMFVRQEHAVVYSEPMSYAAKLQAI